MFGFPHLVVDGQAFYAHMHGETINRFSSVNTDHLVRNDLVGWAIGRIRKSQQKNLDRKLSAVLRFQLFG